jgi:hypothetical membrane protein
LYATAGIIAWLGISLSETLYPNYNVHSKAISALAAIGSPTALYAESTAFVWGLSWIVGSYFLFRHSKNRSLSVAFLIPGIGVLIAALSPANANGLVHAIGSIMVFVPGAIVMLLSFRLVQFQLRYLVIALAVVSLFGTVIEFGARGSQFINDTLGMGGWERVSVYPILIWLVVSGGYFMGRTDEQKKADI